MAFHSGDIGLRLPGCGAATVVAVDPCPGQVPDEDPHRSVRAHGLKRKLLQCSAGPFKKSDFSIGHRGAALQFPEHTRESYEAGARMGAGILECDVTFTKDLRLVCRHAQNDLHTTTNILLTPLASTCTHPFTPAVLGLDGTVITPASAECRTSDITLAEFKTLTGKMDAFDAAALTPEQFVGGTPGFRTDLYAGPTSGHLMTHRESIELFKRLGVKIFGLGRNGNLLRELHGAEVTQCTGSPTCSGRSLLRRCIRVTALSWTRATLIAGARG